jgi:nucleoside 2-deoxyribosyltransferase
MGKCFVIQPFDGGEFDKRYDEVFAPAIKNADLEPYRVDRDPAVSIPIVDIERGIQNSDICLAEITTDNPNVWFELGFAIAAQREVVLVCSKKRESRFPFDVQHRNIILYSTASPSDFSTLGNAITERLKALVTKERQIAKFASSSSIADTEGLSPHEMVALITVTQNQFSPQDSVSVHQIREDMNKAGFTDIAASLSLRGLLRKKMISDDMESDINGNSWSVYRITEKGENWLFHNEGKLILRRSNLPPALPSLPNADDLPF